MEKSEAALRDFILSIRKLVISDKKEDKLTVLMQVAHAFDLCSENEEEKRYLTKCLIDIDFPAQLPRLVLSEPIIVKLSMKIVLILSEDIEVLKTYTGMLACHFRAFVNLSFRDDEGISDLLKDCFTFFKIIEDRLGVVSSFAFEEVCGPNNALAQHCTSMLQTHFCRFGAPDVETSKSIVALGQRFLFMNPRTHHHMLLPMLKSIFHAEYIATEPYSNIRLVTILMSVKVHDYFIIRCNEDQWLQVFYIVILRYFVSVTVPFILEDALKILGYFLSSGGFDLLLQFLSDSTKYKKQFNMMQAQLLICDIFTLLEMEHNYDERKLVIADVRQNYYLLFLCNQWNSLNMDIGLMLKCGPVTSDTLRIWMLLNYLKFRFTFQAERHASALVIDLIMLIHVIRVKKSVFEVHYHFYIFEMFSISCDYLPKEFFENLYDDIKVVVDYLRENVRRDYLERIVSPKYLKTQATILNLTEDEILGLLNTIMVTEDFKAMIQDPISILRKVKKTQSNQLLEYNLIRLMSGMKFTQKQIRELMGFLPKSLRNVEKKDTWSTTFILNLLLNQLPQLTETQRLRVAHYCSWLIQRYTKFTAVMKSNIANLIIGLQMLRIKEMGEPMEEDPKVIVLSDDNEMKEDEEEVHSSWGMKRSSVC